MATQNLNFRSWKQNDKANSLNARLYNGAVAFTVFPKEKAPGASNKPLLSVKFDQDGIGIQNFFKIADMVKKGTIGTKVPMTRTQWDMATKTRKTIWVLTLEKDQEMCYRITLTDCATNATFSFPITNSASFQYGNEPVNKAELSAMGLENLLDWMRLAKMYAPQTIIPPDQLRGGRPSGGGYQAPVAAAPAAAAPSDETMPF